MRLAWMALAAAALWAEEGKWTPQQVLQIDRAWLKQQGLELPVSRLWDPQKGTGLLAAAVNIGGCSGAFVTSTGLVLTNHHCLFGILQEHSRPDRDLITNGFLARTVAQELPGKTTRVSVPRKFRDVTKVVEGAVPAGADDLARSRAIEAKRKELVAECEKQPGARCQVAIFDGGLQYVLIETLELSDVRLVYAPPRAIGEFGGEVDNWMWPRHTGDFSIARAYKDGKPYTPEFWLPVSTRGVKPGEFVMVLGYPGRTVRSLTAAEMAGQRDYFYGLRGKVYGEWIRLLEEKTKDNPAGTIAVAATLKGLLNSWKNSQGQLAGLKRGRTIEKQAEAEAAVLAWAAAKPEWAEAVSAKKELDRLAAERQATGTRDFLFQAITTGPQALRHATTLVRLAGERVKKDAEREPDYQERELGRLRDRLEREQKSYFSVADQAMMASYVEFALKLGPKERIAAIESAFRGADAAAKVRGLYEPAKVTDLNERIKMFGETSDQLRARHDAMLDLAFALEPELKAWQSATKAHEGAVARLRPAWRRAVIGHAGKPVAPDANGTLRVSFAHVKGYEPRDGVFYTPQTTLAGVIEKHTGEDPFNVPEQVRQAAVRAGTSRWRDTALKDVPACFLADADTTGGNSGSPAVNGRGELVGLNFDRVWENVANDFGYNPAVARNINVDLRFLLWMLDEIENASELIAELGVKR